MRISHASDMQARFIRKAFTAKLAKSFFSYPCREIGVPHPAVLFSAPTDNTDHYLESGPVAPSRDGTRYQYRVTAREGPVRACSKNTSSRKYDGSCGASLRSPDMQSH